ncbi:MAG: antibiotic biosynthesis monooxygenase [Bacteroidota bacterium]
MIVEYIRYNINAQRQQDFVAAYLKASQYLQTSRFCLGYELAQCEEESANFILRIEWTSTEDHLTGFRKSSDFPGFLRHVRPFFSNIEEMNHYRLTPVVKKRE